jgi:hypothetical protein
MISKNLDDKIILYSSNTDINFLSCINDINEKKVEENIWQISSKNNSNETDITVDSKIFYLDNADKFLLNLNYNFLSSVDEEKAKFRILLNKNALPCIIDYINKFELTVKTITNWTICKNITNENFHDDKNRKENIYNYTVVFALNNDYTGGQIQFENRVGNDLISMSAGEILIYPSNENYKHKELPVTNGTKYTAIAYF